MGAGRNVQIARHIGLFADQGQCTVGGGSRVTQQRGKLSGGGCFGPRERGLKHSEHFFLLPNDRVCGSESLFQ